MTQKEKLIEAKTMACVIKSVSKRLEYDAKE